MSKAWKRSTGVMGALIVMGLLARADARQTAPMQQGSDVQQADAAEPTGMEQGPDIRTAPEPEALPAARRDVEPVERRRTTVDRQQAEGIDPIWTTPAPPPEPEAAPPPKAMQGPFVTLHDGRGVLETTYALHLQRMPDGPDSRPMTKAVTPYGKWQVACESRDKQSACFAAAYAESDRTVLKVKFGLGAVNDAQGSDDAVHIPIDDGSERNPTTGKPTDQHQAPATDRPAAGRHPRYVLSIEGPPGLDIDTGFDIVATRAAGLLAIDRGCDPTGCRAVSEIAGSLAPILDPGVPDKDEGFAVIASLQGHPYLWRFSTDGLRDAFEKVKEDMVPPPPAIPVKIAKAIPDKTPAGRGRPAKAGFRPSDPASDQPAGKAGAGVDDRTVATQIAPTEVTLGPPPSGRRGRSRPPRLERPHPRRSHPHARHESGRFVPREP